MPASYFKNGSWNIICDVCGFKHKAEEIRKRWDGLLVCKEDFEQDHPQKYLRVRETGQAVPYIREPNDTFIYVCSLWSASGYADLAEADCARADMAIFSYEYLVGLRGSLDLYLDDDALYLDDYELGYE